MLDLADNRAQLEHAVKDGRLVPQTVVSTGGQGTGVDSAAAILGALINNGGGAVPGLAGQSSKK